MTDHDAGHGNVLAEIIAWKRGRTEDMVCVLKPPGECKTHIWSYVTPTGTEHLIIHQQRRAFVRWEVRRGELGAIVEELARLGAPPVRHRFFTLLPREAP